MKRKSWSSRYKHYLTENSNSMAKTEDYIFEQFKERFKKFISEQCEDIMAESFKELAKKCIREEWGKVLDIPLTMVQVAEMFDVERDTVYQWHRRGVMPFYKIQGKLYCNFRDIYSALLDKKKLR